jgi:hypothetical protein
MGVFKNHHVTYGNIHMDRRAKGMALGVDSSDHTRVADLFKVEDTHAYRSPADIPTEGIFSPPNKDRFCYEHEEQSRSFITIFKLL